jgi:hypothetical protein
MADVCVSRLLRKRYVSSRPCGILSASVEFLELMDLCCARQRRETARVELSGVVDRLVTAAHVVAEESGLEDEREVRVSLRVLRQHDNTECA